MRGIGAAAVVGALLGVIAAILWATFDFTLNQRAMVHRQCEDAGGKIVERYCVRREAIINIQKGQ